MEEKEIKSLIVKDSFELSQLTLDTASQPAFQSSYYQLLDTLNYLTDLKKEVDNILKKALEGQYLANGQTSLKGDKVRFTYVSSTVRESLDTKKLKEEMPDIYEKYKKVSEVKDSIRVMINKTEEDK